MEETAPKFRIHYDIEVFSFFLALALLIYTGTVLRAFLPPEIQNSSMAMLFIFPGSSSQNGVVAGAATVSAEIKTPGIIESFFLIPIHFFQAVFESFGF